MPKITKQKAVAPKKKTESVIDRIVDVSEVEGGLSMSIYGTSGSGKTRLAATFPKPILFIGAERGTKSIKHEKDVKFVRLTETDELGELTDYIVRGGFATGVLDTASSLQDMMLKEILGLEDIPVHKTWGMASRDQYGQCSIQMKERLRALLNLSEFGDTNIVIIAQEKNFNDEHTSEIIMPTVGSFLMPSVKGWLDPACDCIVQCFKREEVVTKKLQLGKGKVKTTSVRTGRVEYCLRTGPHSVYTTKFRVTRGTELPNVIVDPTFAKIQEIIEQGG